MFFNTTEQEKVKKHCQICLQITYVSAARLPWLLTIYIDHSYDFLMKNIGGLVQSLELKNCKITTMQGLVS